jgi:hypothetical protein
MRSPHLTSSWPPLLTPFTQKMSEVLLFMSAQKKWFNLELEKVYIWPAISSAEDACRL